MRSALIGLVLLAATACGDKVMPTMFRGRPTGGFLGKPVHHHNLGAGEGPILKWWVLCLPEH